MTFEEWLETLDTREIEKVLFSYYKNFIGGCSCEVCSGARHTSASIKFHQDSILNHNDPEMAKLSFDILKKADKKLINSEIKNRMKEILGV